MIVIIDGHSIAYRAFYKTPPLMTSSGVPTGVIHTFINTLLKIKKKLKPEQIIVAFDSKGETERHRKLKEYKAEREATPDDLIPQIEKLKEILPLMGISVYALEGYEADDIIYTLINKLNTKDIILVTKDKDIYQLVSDRIKIYDDIKDQIIDNKGVLEKFGVAPNQIADFLALTGDISDNIPGVKGIGNVTAKKLLREFNSLDGIYANINKIKGSVKEKLLLNKEIAYLSKSLTELKFIDSLRLDEAKEQREELKEELEALELHTLYNRLFKEDSNNTGIEKLENAYSILIYVGNKLYKVEKSKINMVNSINIEAYKYFYDFKNIYKKYRKIVDDYYDLAVISWLNDPDTKGLVKSKDETIDSFISKVIRVFPLEIEDLKKKNLLKIYNTIERRVTIILAEMELAGIKINKEKLNEISYEIEKIKDKLEKRILKFLNNDINLNSPKQLSDVLYNKLGLKPVKKTKTGLSTSEDSLKEIAIKYPNYKDLIEDILQYREINKLLTTYTKKLVTYIDEKTGRIHTEFKQTGTATGRLSSNNPNLQNIPQRGELAKSIRSAFISEEGYSFISFDYSQIELRILAHLSNDENLVTAFQKGYDIHSLTAKIIFNLEDLSLVSSDMRRIAKAINFGIIYGLSPYGLSKEIGISQSEAKEFIDKYFTLYPKVKTYINSIVELARNNGYTETIFNRRRYIKDISSKNNLIRKKAERVAINAPIQGSAADIIKLAMIKVSEFIKKKSYDARLLLQIHDELIVEVSDDIVEIATKEIKSIMESIADLEVALVVNCGVGKNLGALKI